MNTKSSIKNEIGKRIVKHLDMFGLYKPIGKREIMGVVHRSRADVAMREFRKLANRALCDKPMMRHAYLFHDGAYYMTAWYYHWLRRHCV